MGQGGARVEDGWLCGAEMRARRRARAREFMLLTVRRREGLRGYEVSLSTSFTSKSRPAIQKCHLFKGRKERRVGWYMAKGMAEKITVSVCMVHRGSTKRRKGRRKHSES